MNALHPFFALLGRASVFWLGLVGFACVSLIVAGVVEPDARLGLYVDGVILAALIYPLAGGWLAGAVIQELQHTTFAWALPRLRRRLATGFSVTGLLFCTAIVGLIAQMSTMPHDLPLLFVVALGAWCLGGIFVDPLSPALSFVTIGGALAMIFLSQQIGDLAVRAPWLVAGVAAVVAAGSLWRLFARSTLRLKPFRAQNPFPGNYSLEKSRETQRRQHVKAARAGRRWNARPFGTQPWRWVRAAVHEAHGAHGLKTVPRAISRAWGIGALIALNAWLDKGELGFGAAVARTLFDALLHSPHELPIGVKGGLYPLTTLVLSAAVAISAVSSPTALYDGLGQPLSRRMRASVRYRGGLVDLGLFLGIAAPSLFAIGHLCGRLVGLEPRFDYMPYFFRVMMVSMILAPLAHALRLWIIGAAQRRQSNTLVAVIFGVTGFVLAACLLTWVSPRLFGAPLPELAGLGAVLVASQLLYRQQLGRYFRTADLA